MPPATNPALGLAECRRLRLSLDKLQCACAVTAREESIQKDSFLVREPPHSWRISAIKGAEIVSELDSPNDRDVVQVVTGALLL